MRWLRRGIVLAVIVGVLVGGWSFASANAGRVTLSYVFGELDDVPLWQALAGAFGAGLVVAGLLASVANLRLKLVARRYRRAMHGLEAEVHQLRSLPLDAAGDLPVDAERSPPDGVPAPAPRPARALEGGS